jgi:hypothetical protein
MPAGLKFLGGVLAALNEVEPFRLDEPVLQELPMGLEPEIEIGGTIYASFQRDDVVVTVGPRVVTSRWAQTVCQAPYPRYARLKRVLFETCSRCESLLGRRNDYVVANMSYINAIPPEVAETVGVHTVLANMDPKHPAIPSSRLNQIEFGWREQDGIDMRITARQKEQDLILDCGSGAFLMGRSPSEMLDLMHDRLNDLFPRILTDDAKRRFGFEPNEAA